MKLFINIACTTAIAFILWTSHAFGASSALRPESGRVPPLFSLKDAGGKETALAKGTPIVIVHFFATTCEACLEELPALSRLYQRGKKDLAIYAISVGEPEIRVRRFSEKMHLDLPVLIDSDRTTAKAWKVASLPTTFVLDADLTVRLLVEERFAWDSVDAARLKGLMGHASETSTLLNKSE